MRNRSTWKNEMRQKTTWAILRRLPALLAVTAQSYGLCWQAVEVGRPAAAGASRRDDLGRTRGGPEARR